MDDNKAKNKNTIFMLVSAASLLCVIVLLLVMLFSPKPVAPGGQEQALTAPFPSSSAQTAAPSPLNNRVALSADEVGTLLYAALPDDFPIKNINVAFYDGEAYLSGVADGKAMASYLEKEGDAPQALLSALRLIPNETMIQLSFGMPRDESSPLRLEPISLSLGKTTLDVSMVPESLIDTLSASLSESLLAYGGVISHAYLENDQLVLEFSRT